MNSRWCNNQIGQNVAVISSELVELLKGVKIDQIPTRESPDAVQSVNAIVDWQAFRPQVEINQQFQHQQPLFYVNTPILLERINSTSSPNDHVMGVKKTYNQRGMVQCSHIQSTSPPNSQSNHCKIVWPKISESLMNVATRKSTGRRRSLRKKLSKRIKSKNCETMNTDFDLMSLNPCMGQGNLLLRMLRLFRQMHYYTNDMLSSPYSYNSHDDYAYMISPTLTMQRNLNLSKQVTQAVQQCTVFLCDMNRVMKANQLYDLQRYNDCECLVWELRSLIAIMSAYQNVAMDHSCGEFNTPFNRTSAEHLEIVLTLINKKIRQLHIEVHVFDWAVQKSLNREEPTMNRMQRNHQQFIQNQLELQEQVLEQVGPSDGALWTVSTAARNCFDHTVQMTEMSRLSDWIAEEQNRGINTNLDYNCGTDEERNLIRYIG